MNKFQNLFGRLQSVVIGMVHLKALPGTPKNERSIAEIVEDGCRQAEIYHKHNVDGILIENMNDVPYVKQNAIGHEITAAMTRICTDVRRTVPRLPIGVQVLAGGNEHALAICSVAGCNFVRVEGFVYAHVADEGFMESCAGRLLRYRKRINAENVLIFADIKKKHSSHAITADVSLETTAKTAEFFLGDGVVLTGQLTGDPVTPSDLKGVSKATSLPVLIGSGISYGNMEDYIHANAFIVGSSFKTGKIWQNELNDDFVSEFMNKVKLLRQTHNLK